MNRLFLGSAIALASLAMPSSVRAQYYNPYGNPFVGSGRGYNYGAAAQGQAQVIGANSQVTLNNENARILREQANQAKIDTKRKAFDELAYEKANTPTYTQTLTKDKAATLQRLMTFPTRSEIADGRTLNVMLPLLADLSLQGTQGPPIPLSQSIVNDLNISNSGTSSIGVLRAGGQVEWPIGLRGPQQKKLDKLLPEAYDATRDGTLTLMLMKQVRTEMKTMRDTLRTQLQTEEIDGNSYVVALEFYMSLESSVNALERPDARKQLAGAYSPRARNVQELVDFMTDKGLLFAPAMPGQENAYQVTHDAFVRYVRVAQSSSGMQSLSSPTMMPSKKR